MPIIYSGSPKIKLTNIHMRFTNIKYIRKINLRNLKIMVRGTRTKAGVVQKANKSKKTPLYK